MLESVLEPFRKEMAVKVPKKAIIEAAKGDSLVMIYLCNWVRICGLWLQIQRELSRGEHVKTYVSCQSNATRL